ncbi:hypothetical protein QBC38DRAFT_64330 [Podospora fimiseda]|uniref:Uncharacterized protein n=1 Tax=Podospora fimiseda TaxID=252190 RepID=A0AAN7BV48_9PEZI|nr:hypothetical protein QBC38DRAFT_64330 [Podospora fimiseda]
MVGGKQVLLSLAVLYGAGPNSALGGLLRPQDGAQSIGGGSFANTTSQASSLLSSLEAPVATTSTELGTTMTTSSIRRPPAPPPALPPNLPPVLSSVVQGSSIVLNLGFSQATVNAASTSSKVDEYVYPAVNGADGPLTTESDAYTRSVMATRNSVSPNPGTIRAPPPVDVDVPSTSIENAPRPMPTRPPPRPEPAGPPPVQEPEDTPVETSSEAEASNTGAPANIPTPPRGGGLVGIPTRTLAPTTAGITLSFGLGQGDDPSPQPTHSFDYGPGGNHTGLYPNQTITPGPAATKSLSICKSSDYTIPPTVWSIVHTETITWYGKPEDYTPSYPPIVAPTGSTCVDPPEPPRFTISVCTSTGSDSKYVTCHFSTSTDSWIYGPGIHSKPTLNPITFTTTDKNPAVVYATRDPPDYGVSQGASTRRDYVSPTDHPVPVSVPQYQSQGPGRNPGGGGPGSPQYMSSEPGRQPPTTPAPQPITITFQPTGVIIGTSTVSDQPSKPTQVVVISDETFTVDPTRVVGGGTTIDRPRITGGVIYPPTPTTTTLADVPVVITSSIAVIGGSSFTLGPSRTTTAVVSGRTFTINPSGVAADTQTLNLPSNPIPTEVVVAGGELITAIGPSVLVIKSTTITYGPASPPITTEIGDEKLVLGPGGVTLGNGEVITAKPGETQFAVAGGVTITKIGASVVVVGGETYTAGPEMGTTTKVVEVGGQKVTIGSEEVVIGTAMSIAVPFGPVTVITPGATRALGGMER